VAIYLVFAHLFGHQVYLLPLKPNQVAKKRKSRPIRSIRGAGLVSIAFFINSLTALKIWSDSIVLSRMGSNLFDTGGSTPSYSPSFTLRSGSQNLYFICVFPPLIGWISLPDWSSLSPDWSVSLHFITFLMVSMCRFLLHKNDSTKFFDSVNFNRSEFHWGNSRWRSGLLRLSAVSNHETLSWHLLVFNEGIRFRNEEALKPTTFTQMTQVIQYTNKTQKARNRFYYPLKDVVLLPVVNVGMTMIQTMFTLFIQLPTYP